MFAGVILPQVEAFVSTVAPVDGTSAAYTLTMGGGVTAGTFRLMLPGVGPIAGGETTDIAFGAVLATVQAAYDAVYGSGNSVLSGTDLPGALTVTLAASLGRVAIPIPTISRTSLVGGTVAIAQTVAGVTATLLGVPTGTIVWDQTGLEMWVNRGTTTVPNWCPLSGIWRNAGAPTNGVTFATKARAGSFLVDTTNGKVYVNTNTLASPTWTVVGTQT